MHPGSLFSRPFKKLARWNLHPLLAFLGCLLVGLLSYAPALRGDLIWDDCYLVSENPFFRSPVFGLEVFRHFLFFESFSTYYRPVQNWSYMLDYWAWGGNPLGYHLTNLLLHSISGWLLFLLLRRLLIDLWPAPEGAQPASHGFCALLVAVLWIVHPVHNAAVAYISGRADSLAALFALTGWLLLLRSFDVNQRWSKAACAGLAALSMLIALCSKEIALIWLVLILGHLWAFDRTRSWRERWAVLAGALSVLGIYAALHSLPGYRAPMEGGSAAPWDARILLMLRALGDYASLLIYPGQLYMERAISSPAIYRTVAVWRENVHFEYLSVFGLLALLAIGFLSLRRTPGQRLRVFGAAWFFIAFLPISNLFPLNAEVAEHWIYLASIGFLLFLAGTVLALPPRVRYAATVASLLFIAAFATRTARRSSDWVNTETFCARTIAAGGGTPRVLSTLAAYYGQRGDFAKQEQILRQMIAQFPDFTPARINLSICLSRQGRVAEAEASLSTAPAQTAEAARHYPRTWTAALQLAQLRRDAGRPDEALAIIREARSRFPETWELAKGEAELLRQTRGPEAAIPAVAAFAGARWWHRDAQSMLAALQFAAGRHDEAIASLRAASRLDLHDARALAGIAEIESARGRPAAALDVLLEAMDRDPEQPAHYASLAGILEKLGRKSEASAALHKAQTLATRGGS